MDNQEKMLAKMREIAQQNPENIRIIETSVDSDIQIEFFEAIQYANDNYDIVDFEKLYADLISDTISIEQKKEILLSLTVAGEVESFRLLESYLKIAIEDLKTWAFLACQQGRMFLESKLLEESKIYIASGLGGKEHRLRYLFAVSTRNEDISPAQQKIVEGEIDYYLKKDDAITEKIEFDGKFIICIALIPIYVDIVELVQSIVEEVNQYGNFIKENIFITNEKAKTPEELKEIFEDKEEK